MPSINHTNLGDVQQHEYLPGVILKVYPEKVGTPEAHWDTADVYVEGVRLTWGKAPIFYHCSPDQPIRNNGAIVAGARGFMENDRVILLCKIQTARLGDQQVADVTVIGHEDGIRKCSYNYVIIRAGLQALPPLEIENPEANLDEYCTVYDVVGKTTASIVDPDSDPAVPLVFPCPVAKIKPFLRYAELMGVPLFEEFPQGDDQIQIAGAVPNWKDDGQGNAIRGEASPKDWWTSYDVDNNPVQEFFEEMSIALMLDNEGAANGTYQQTMDVLERNQANVTAWANRSPAFRVDDRTYTVTGPENLSVASAVGVDGFLAAKATSKHIQTAYGEDEIWVCAVNSFHGIIVSYCDEAWKFVRFEEVPPNLGIPGLDAALLKLVNAASIAGAVPVATGSTTSALSIALAGMITLAGKGGENSIWSIGVLKRINEGAFHRTIHPAMSGSVALQMTPIPEDTQREPRHLSALNRRWDKIDTWYRYDNWHNTIDVASGTWGVNVTWWFRSAAQKWGAEAIYADTPLGSMWLQAPDWRAAVWYMPSLSNSSMIARRDLPITQALTHACKHSRSVVAQLYIAQRTSITLWAEQEDVFVKQEVGVDPYFSIPPGEDGKDAISFVKMPDNSRKHIDAMTDEDFDAVLSDLVVIRSVCPGEDPGTVPANQAFRQNRNEFEVMGAADLYGDLMTRFKRRNPVDQVRVPEFERAVANLITGVMATATTTGQKLFTDMEIV